jgi:hypothetical protein
MEYGVIEDQEINRHDVPFYSPHPYGFVQH